MTEQDPNKTDYTFAGGLSGVNPAELDPQDIQKLRDVTDQGIEALKHRYDNPNWFKVAAGFAKPTGGNFLASLGNALEPLGENVEQERANIQPVVNAQILREQSNMLLAQKIKQNQIFQEWRASGKPMDENTNTRISSLGSNTDVAKAAAKFWEQAKARVGTKVEQQRGDIELGDYTQRQLDAINKNPLLKFVQDAPDKVGQVSAVSPDVAKQIEANLDKVLLRNNTPEAIKGMSFLQKQNEVAAMVEANSRRSMTQKDKDADAAMNSSNRLSDLNEARYLATRPGMDELFGLFNSGDGLNLLKTLANSSGDKYAQASSAIQDYIFSNFANDNPKLRQEADQLMKLVNKLSLDTRNASTNPTNLVQEMAKNVNPDFGQSHIGFLSILDQLGFEDKFNIDKSNLRNKTEGMDANSILSNDEFRQMQSRYKRERSQHSTLDPTQHMPSWYVSLSDEGKPTTPAPAEPAASASTAPAPAPSGNAQQTRSSIGDSIRKKLGRN